MSCLHASLPTSDFPAFWVYGVTAVSEAPSRGLTNGLPRAVWRATPDADEVDAYDYLTASTDEDIEMDLGGGDYFFVSGAPGEPMTPPPEHTTHPYCSMSSSSWQNGPIPAGADIAPSPASTGTSASGTRPARRRRRRLEGRVEFAVHAKPPAGGLGRVLDQKRVRLDRRRQAPPCSAAQRQRRLRTPKESHVNKSPPRHRVKSWSHRQLALCLTRIEPLDPMPGVEELGGWWGLTCWEAISATNMEQVPEEMDWVSDAEDKEAARGGSQVVDSCPGLEPVHEDHQTEPAPANMPMGVADTCPSLMSSTSISMPPTHGSSSDEPEDDEPVPSPTEPLTEAALASTADAYADAAALAWLDSQDWTAKSQVYQSQAYEDWADAQDDDDPDLQDPAEQGHSEGPEDSTLWESPVVAPAAEAGQDPQKGQDWDEL